MPTTRKRRTRGAASKVPAWWLHFIATGERPPEDHPQIDQFYAAWLLNGWARSQGWPEAPEGR
jgi:hypothetical protein